MIRLAHISDLHFSIIKLGFKDLFSKRFIGILNLLINRKKNYSQKPLYSLHSLFETMDIDHVLISGDLTSTSLNEEFIEAKNFVQKLNSYLIIPGNHDKYTKKSHKTNRFYNYFKTDDSLFSKNLKKDGIEIKELKDNWYYIGLDSCIATSYLSSSGYFSKKLEKDLLEVLETMKDKKIIIANHFPLISNNSKRKTLHRKEALIELIKKHPNVKLYLYGHTHNFSIKKEKDMPYMICPGCACDINFGSFNILEIENDILDITTYKWLNQTWNINNKTTLNL